jgi:peroxiredoxin
MSAMSDVAGSKPRWQKPVVGAAVAVAVILGALYLRAPESTKVKVGMQAPDLPLVGERGGEQRLSTYRGRPVLLAFFMSDCEICQEEIPELELLNREFRTQGLVVLGVSVDADFAAYKSFLLKKNLTFGVFRDPGGTRILEYFGSHKLPEAYLIDATGQVAAVWLGSVRWRSQAIRERLTDVLPEP